MKIDIYEIQLLKAVQKLYNFLCSTVQEQRKSEIKLLTTKIFQE